MTYTIEKTSDHFGREQFMLHIKHKEVAVIYYEGSTQNLQLSFITKSNNYKDYFKNKKKLFNLGVRLYDDGVSFEELSYYTNTISCVSIKKHIRSERIKELLYEL